MTFDADLGSGMGDWAGTALRVTVVLRVSF